MSKNKPTPQDLINVAEERRKLEIELLWQRSLILSGITLAAFAAYATLNNPSNASSSSITGELVVCVGFFSAFIWTLVNRGSKYWQEYWEAQIQKVFGDYKDYDFFDKMEEDAPKDDPEKYYKPKNDRGILCNLIHGNGMRFSPSKLMITLSDFFTLVWAAFIFFVYPQLFSNYWFLGGGIICLIAALRSYHH